MDGQFSNFYEYGQNEYFEYSFECPSQWNQYEPSFDQNLTFYDESFENSYNPNEYDHSNQFQDPNPRFQNFQKKKRFFKLSQV